MFTCRDGRSTDVGSVRICAEGVFSPAEGLPQLLHRLAGIGKETL